MPKSIHINLVSLKPFALEKGETRKAHIQAQREVVLKLRNQGLSEYFAVDIADDSIVRTEHGKPYFQNYPTYSFNHSHSQNMYALAMSQTVKNLGVDIEELDRQVRFEALAKHAFHADELLQWQVLDYDLEYWFRVWTTKEAVLKASGLGIRMSLNELNTQVHPEQSGGMCMHPKLGVFAYQNYNIAGCMLTVAWESAQSCKGFNFPDIHIVSSI